ncbi:MULTISPECIES: DUF4282 domain-containing protein [Citrobacter]|uniref:DUF4282 domain-containing protein n=1 Tax=Citrobacter telavivensis TaxID=2653932 RepID=A0A6L5E1R1_9ENTR|nr:MULTISPECIES: DUF4282 domain-containing protein [Citrobacter]MPQ49419.1 DUF4282 domain-containing protein [Citrobacter telavivensis]QFS72523.1 DUF4282 domain-containing protein [Citrobacter telavivensis]CAI9397490.1 hypothetical protein CITSP_02136 [Citrobacter sp. T1.2D-1]
MKVILGFDSLLTPKIMVFLYWIFMVLVAVVGVISIFNGQIIAGLFGTAFSLVGCRVMFELIMIAFKNNEYLRLIAQNSNKSE